MRLESLEAQRPVGDDLLYLPSGKLLRVWSLGYQDTLADLIYLWSIQFYGNYRGGVRYDYLTQIYENVITELDPQFRDAYLLGALILSLEARRPEDALTLLDKGVRKNPDDWILPFEAGFIAYDSLQDYSRAADYFEIARKRPGAPPVVSRFHAEMYHHMGDRRAALDLWREVYDTANSEYVREVARKHVHDLTIEYHVWVLQQAVERYHEQQGQFPPDLATLVKAGLIEHVPVDPEGLPYRYDPATGQVTARGRRMLPERRSR